MKAKADKPSRARITEETSRVPIDIGKRDPAPKRHAPTLRADALERLRKGDLRHLGQQGVPAVDHASAARDGRSVPVLLVTVSDRRGATRGGIPVQLEDADGGVVARGQTDRRGRVLLRADGLGGLAQRGRVRVLDGGASRSRAITMPAERLAHQVGIRLERLPARADVQAQTPAGSALGGATDDPLADAAAEEVLADVEEAADALVATIQDPEATDAEKDAARAELEELLQTADARIEGETPPAVKEVLDTAQEMLDAGDDAGALLTAAQALEAAAEAARLALAREDLRDILTQYREGALTLEALLERLDAADLAGLDLGRDLFNQLPLDFAPEVFDLIVSEGLALQDSIFAGAAPAGDFRGARTRLVKRFALPRQPTATSPDTRYLVRFRQEWAFLGYTLGGLTRAEPLDPGVATRSLQGVSETARHLASRNELRALREMALQTSNLLQQTSSTEGFMAAATSLRVRQKAAGFASVGPRVSVGDDPVGGLLGGLGGAAAGGLAGALVGGLPGAVLGATAGGAAGAFYGSGGRTDLGGDAGVDLLTRVNTTTSLRGGVESSLQVNSLLQSTQSLVDQNLRTLASTLNQVERTLSENVERISPVLDRVTNLLRWSMHENYAVLTRVEDVLPVRVLRLTDLAELDEASRQAVADLLAAVQLLEDAIKAARAALADLVDGYPYPNATVLNQVKANLVQALASVEAKAVAVRDNVGLRTLGGGTLTALLESVATRVDEVQALMNSQQGTPGSNMVQGALQRLALLAADLRDLRELLVALDAEDPLLFAPEDVVEYRRIFQPQLLEPLLAGRFESLRRDLELLRNAELPVHRIDVIVEHGGQNAPAQLRLDVGPDHPSVILDLVPGRSETGATLHLAYPVAAADVGPARLHLTVDGPQLGNANPASGLPGVPGFTGVTTAEVVAQMVEAIRRQMRASVTRVRFRYHLLEGLTLDQVVYPGGDLSASAADGTVTHVVALEVPRPAVSPLEDPLVRHVNRNRVHYLGLLMQAAMVEPSLRDDSPHLAALNGASEIWQMPILGFEGDRLLVLDRLDDKLDEEAKTWLDDAGAATLVQVPVVGAYGEALQGLLRLTDLAETLHPALQPPPAPAMPPLAVVDLTGKRLVPEVPQP